MPNQPRRFRPTQVQLLGFALYVPSTLIALVTSLSQVEGVRLLIIILCLPAILVGILLMVLGSGGAPTE